MLPKKYTVKFTDVGKEDIGLVGGKGANLGEMTKAGFPVPSGFIVTAKAYFDFIRENDLQTKISHLLGTIDFANQRSLEKVSKHIKAFIRDGSMSETLIAEIFQAYSLISGLSKDALVAVRSSATAEDLPNASFAGQQETFLNVQGEATLLLRIKDVWSSLFDPRAIFYRHEQKYDDFKVGIAVPVQQMVASETSGIMFTIDPVTNDASKIVIEAIYGLGELIVQGAVTPDHYEVKKEDMSIIAKTIAPQMKMLTRKGPQNKIVSVGQKKGKEQKITDKQIVALAQLGKQLENHYQSPQDSEWAIADNKIYLVQTRPVTTFKSQIPNPKNQPPLKSGNMKLKTLLQGSPASPGIAVGVVKILKDATELTKIVQGDVLVTRQTNPDFVPAMKKAVAIVTQEGGRTSHAAIVSRELGIPAVVGTPDALKTLVDGMIITVNGSTGEIFTGSTGPVMNNQLTTHDSPIHTATKVYVNLAQPDLADSIAKRHVDGIGLLRAEFMMADIGVHPKQMIHDGKRKEYVEKLAKGIAIFAKSFTPRPIVYRASDFKTNEYRHLQGGEIFEPIEANPMLGYRGAFRYIHDPELFAMELDAIKMVRNTMGFTNVWLMLPFVRTVVELVEVKKLINSSGLYRSPNFKIWMMVEIPSNVILLDKFIEVGIDGVSIGSNDLTMLLLGVDRDNTEIEKEFDEQNEAVLWAIEHVIKMAHKHHITSSLCGQAVSTYPKFLEHLIRWGITSVSVSPDAITTTREHIAEIERRLLSS